MRFEKNYSRCEPVVITGIGMLTSVGKTAESTWQSVQQGKSGVRSIAGLRGIPDDLLIGAPVDLEVPQSGQLKVIALCQEAARSAIEDASLGETPWRSCATSPPAPRVGVGAFWW